jgi:hypothetical protein
MRAKLRNDFIQNDPGGGHVPVLGEGVPGAAFPAFARMKISKVLRI